MTMTLVWCIRMTCTGHPQPCHKADKGDTSILIISSIMRVHHQATLLMIPSSTIFWKVLIVCVNERVNHRNLIQANNSKKCHSHNNNNSRSRFPNSRQPLPRSSPVHPLFTSLRHHNDNSNNSISNHNNKDLSRNRSRRLYKNRRMASSKQVLGNPLQKDRDNLNGSESLP